MPQWQGKTRGTRLGYRIFVSICRFAGVGPAYVLLRIVALYFFLFAFSSSQHIYRYFRQRHGWGKLKSIRGVYTNYYRFGQTIIDKIAISAGLKNTFTFHLDGEENLVDIVNERRGGILLSGHVGNWEMAGHFLNRLDTVFHIVMFDGEHEKVKDYINEVTGKNRLKIIIVRDDLSHVYQIGEALQKNELVCMHADRYIAKEKTVRCDFLGASALFPAGPFALASAFNVPVSFVFAFKETTTHYHFFGSKLIRMNEAESKREYSNRLQRRFATEMEKMVRAYPEQWFNYYDFWMK
jgi:predicted LPLAT superfamily acyltransferase